jgi:hypothetical protein
MCDLFCRHKTIAKLLRKHLCRNNKKLTNTEQSLLLSRIVKKRLVFCHVKVTGKQIFLLSKIRRSDYLLFYAKILLIDANLMLMNAGLMLI